MENPDRFIQSIKKLCSNKKYDVLMPIGLEATLLLAKEKQQFDQITTVPVADFDKVALASDKGKAIELAEKVGVPTPRTISASKRDLAEVEGLHYPLVLKATTGSGLLFYVNNKKELLEKTQALEETSGCAPILQEYVKGEGYGFFALYNHGEQRATFMHKRLREYPATGGPSSFAESIYDAKLEEYGLRILDSLTWHGVAMVEFKKSDADNEFKLMEINTKFWGSLDLAIAAGINFPFLLYKMATEGDVPRSRDYKVGLKFLWPFPQDFLNSLSNPLCFGSFVKDLTDQRVKKNIEFNDPKPLAVQLAQTAMLSVRKLKTPSQLRYPQGKPIGV